jgi:hypothetical protein
MIKHLHEHVDMWKSFKPLMQDLTLLVFRKTKIAHLDIKMYNF